MKLLKEIAQVVTKYQKKNVMKLGSSGNRPGRKMQHTKDFIGGMLKGRYTSDDHAAQEIYGVKSTHPNYRKLKSRVRERLFNALFELDIRQLRSSPTLEAMYQCNKYLVCIKILLALGARNSAITLAHRTLIRAQQAHLFDIVYQCARILRSYYSLIGMEKQFDEYDRMSGAMQKIQKAEDESDRLKEHLLVKYARSTSKKSEFINLAAEYVQNLDKLQKRYPTNTVIMNAFRVKSLYYQISRDFPAVIQMCKEAEEYFDKHQQFANNSRRAEFALIKMVACLHLRDYDNGKRNAEQCIKLFYTGSNNWLTFMEYYFLLALHSGNFEQAVSIFQEVTCHPRFISGPQFKQEKWKVYEGYLNYIFESGKETHTTQQIVDFRRNFNVNKFLNEVPTFSKDKQGMNVSILILQILFLLERGQMDTITNHIEALRVYTSRYLKKDESYRSELFMRMLVTMESKSFHYKATFQATQGYHSRLLAAAQGEHGSMDGTEIIPFELLWERILIKLQSLPKSALPVRHDTTHNGHTRGKFENNTGQKRENSVGIKKAKAVV